MLGAVVCGVSVAMGNMGVVLAVMAVGWAAVEEGSVAAVAAAIATRYPSDDSRDMASSSSWR